jgi:MFS transporter, AAHS family, benzoate transport protein
MKEMAIAPAKAGLMVSSALFGMMFGNILLGTIADRIGRRWAIAICIALFSVFTAAAGRSTDPLMFSVARFIAGVGFGGVMPNVIAQMTEYAPRRLRSTMVTLMFSGYSVGGLLAALLGKGLIERYGWPSVFFAAAFPALLIPMVMKWMPESIPFLIKSGRRDELQRIVGRLDRSYRAHSDDQFIVPRNDKVRSAPVRQLFDEGRGLSTIMLWLACFMCLFMVYALSSWLTKLMASEGHSLGSALTFVVVLNLGAMIGAIGGGWLADKFHIKFVLVCMYAMASLSITLLGYKVPTELLYVLVGLAGASTIGTQTVTCAYAGQLYPMAIRGTGIGWMLGIGRGGAILAPIVIGVLVGMEMPLQQNFMAIGIPGVVAAIAVSLISHGRSASAQPGSTSNVYRVAAAMASETDLHAANPALKTRE